MKVVRKLYNEVNKSGGSKAKLFSKQNKEPSPKIQKSPSLKSLIIFIVTAIIFLALVVVLVLYANETLFGQAITQDALARPVILTQCGAPDDDWVRNTLYQLDGDIVVPSGTRECFTFTGSERIKFDCRGHAIVGAGTPGGIAQTGIVLVGTRDVTVENCKFSGLSPGIRLTINSVENVIHDNFFEGSASGIIVQSSNNNLFHRNQIKGARPMSIIITGSSGNIFARNDLNGGLDAMILFNSNGNSFVNNNIHDFERIGLGADQSSSNNNLLHNQFSRNELAVGVSSENNRLKENIICDRNRAIFFCEVPVIDAGGNYLSVRPAVACGNWQLFTTGATTTGYRACPAPDDFALSGCEGKQCGQGTNGVSCGTCVAGRTCNVDGWCEAQAAPSCTVRAANCNQAGVSCPSGPGGVAVPVDIIVCGGSTPSCNAATGLCEAAFCAATTTPETSCNGIDDDCDGSVDEDFAGTSTTCGVGACASTGLTTCPRVSGQAALGNTCVPGTQTAEVCADNLDNDCDGTVNNGCAGACSSSADCTGTDKCDLQQTPSACVPCVAVSQVFAAIQEYYNTGNAAPVFQLIQLWYRLGC